MKKDWTKQEIENLTHVIEEHGKTEGIKLFAAKSGRTENSVRIKWGRTLKDYLKDNEQENIKPFEEQVYTEEECCKNEPSWWHKIISTFHKIW